MLGKVCKGCGLGFRPKRRSQLFCTVKCGHWFREAQRKKCGLCIQCGSAVLEGHCRCLECHQRLLQISGTHHRKRMRQGYCGACGHRPAIKGSAKCGYCTRKMAERQAMKIADRQIDKEMAAEDEGLIPQWEVCALLGIDRKTLWNWRQKGILTEKARINRVPWFRKVDCEQLVSR